MHLYITLTNIHSFGKNRRTEVKAKQARNASPDIIIKKGGTVGTLCQKIIENLALNLNLHLKCNGFHLPAFIQGLIGSNCHPYLITYSKITIKAS